METIINYIKEHWILCLIGVFFVGWFTYLTFDGNQFCDCEKQKPTETEPQEDTTLPEWDITDTITNKI
jgi:hypothetical protein